MYMPQPRKKATFTCEHCGVEVETYPARAARAKFCSSRCRAIAWNKAKPPAAGRPKTPEHRAKIAQARRDSSFSTKGMTYQITESDRQRRAEHMNEVRPPVRRGAESPSWNGGRTRTPTGYIMIHRPLHPFANKRGYVFEHRLVVEEADGVVLTPNQIVHHINHVTDDNRRENLRVMTYAEHSALHRLEDAATRKQHKNSSP